MTRSPDHRDEPVFLPALLLLVAFAAIRLLTPAPRPKRAMAPTPREPDAWEEHAPMVQRLRAVEPGRGRAAASPLQIPWKGWKDIGLRTRQQVGEDRLLALAAGVVFYALLALFPAVTA